MGTFIMVLDFNDNASFKYYTDREKYEAAEVGAFLDGIRKNPNSCVIDVGANYGAFCLAAAAAWREGTPSKIIAIEPDRRAYCALEKSIRINGFQNILAVRQAIAGDRCGSETLYENARSSADNRSHQVATAPIRVRSRYSVPCSTVDALVEAEGVSFASKFVIKMDIQGNEFRAMRGMKRILQESSGWLLFFEHAPYLIESAGLELAQYHHFLASLAPDFMMEICPSGLERLADFSAFEKSVNRFAFQRDRRFQGTGSNYVFGRRMVFCSNDLGKL